MIPHCRYARIAACSRSRQSLVSWGSGLSQTFWNDVVLQQLACDLPTCTQVRKLPFLDLRGLGYSDEDLLALAAAFPYTGG